MELEKQPIHAVVADYAQALSQGNPKTIAAFYTEDGIFMPSGHPTITGREKLEKSGEQFFAKQRLQIHFAVKDITLTSDFAFVRAVATTTLKPLAVEKAQTLTSRDFFVLQKLDGSWKIYRYIFNQFKG